MAMVSNNHFEQVNLPVIIDLKEKEENKIQQTQPQPQQPQQQEEETLEQAVVEQSIRMEIEEDDFTHIVSNEQAQERQVMEIMEAQDEEEEEEDYDYDDEDDEEEDDDDIYYLNDHIIHYNDNPEQLVDLERGGTAVQQQQTEEDENDSFYLANKTFYTTCHKISRQNSPSYRKRPPYTFLENWLIHSVFSKSQQILLRFPVIHPKVMMTEGDFIYTPHQQQPQQEQEPVQEDITNMYYYNQDGTMQDIMEEDEEEAYYQEGEEDEEDAFIIGDEDVIVMSASAPDVSQFMALDDDEDLVENHSIMMDENMWMGHSRYNSNGLTLHVVNPDQEDSDEEEEEQKDPMYHSHPNNPYKSVLHNEEQHLEQVREEEEAQEQEEEEEIEDSIPISISPEILNWYRTATDNTNIISVKQQAQPVEEEDIEECHSSTSSTYSNHDNEHSSSAKSIESYQSLADIIQEEEGQSTSTMYGTLPTTTTRAIPNEEQQLEQQQKSISPLMQVSVCFVDAAWVAMDLAQNYTEEKGNASGGGVTGFITTLFRIWKVLFLGAETMLGWEKVKSQAIV